MIGIGNEHGVDRSWRKPRVVYIAVDDVKIRMAATPRTNPEKRERLPSKIHSKDPTARTDAWGDFQSEITGAGSQIDHRLAGTNAQVPDDVLGTLPGVAFTFHLVEGAKRSNRLVADEHRSDQKNQTSHNGDPLHSWPRLSHGICRATRFARVTLPLHCQGS